MRPLVPGFIIAGELTSSTTGSTWVAVRSQDDHRFVLRIVPVSDVIQAQALAVQHLAMLRRIESDHLVRQHNFIVLADGTLALVFDEFTGGTLAQVIGARGQLTPGETVTTLAPLLGALADLHAAGFVHANLTPLNVVFNADGKPMLGDFGVASLLGRHAGPFDEASGFVAPELLDGAVASPASDVYAMAALGWLCLTGVPPQPVGTRASPTTWGPDTPRRLVDILISCLATDPAARPSASAAAVEIFDAAPAVSVALASVSDPAAEITRRIRAAAVPLPTRPSGTARTRRRYRDPLFIGVVALLVAVASGVGATWLDRRPPTPVSSMTTSASPAGTGTVSPPVGSGTVSPPVGSGTVSPPAGRGTASTPSAVTSAIRREDITEVVSAPDSPRTAAAGLLQALVDARALAYVARDSALLDLVYAPGGPKADVDKGNIATALKNGGTYVGLSFVIKDVTFLDGTFRYRPDPSHGSHARIRDRTTGRTQGLPRAGRRGSTRLLAETDSGWLADLGSDGPLGPVKA